MKRALLTVFAALAGAYFGALCGAHIGGWAMESIDWGMGGFRGYAAAYTMVLGFVGGAIAGVYLVGSIGVGYIRPPQCEQPMPRKGLE